MIMEAGEQADRLARLLRAHGWDEPGAIAKARNLVDVMRTIDDEPYRPGGLLIAVHASLKLPVQGELGHTHVGVASDVVQAWLVLR
jgi:hypothetical protein